MDRILLSTLVSVLAWSVVSLAGCGTESGTADDSDTDTVNKGTTVENETTSSECATLFMGRLNECGIPVDAEGTANVEGVCTRLDTLFIDSFSQGIMSCLVETDCEALIGLMESPDAGLPDGEIPDGGVQMSSGIPEAISACMFSSLLTMEQSPKNEAFKQQYCAWYASCDTEMTQSACEVSFTNTDMFLFLVMEDTYITAATQCITPAPPCENGQAVEVCFQVVLNDFANDMSFE